MEECGLPYRFVPVNIGKGEQFSPGFLAISPNNRMPAIVDHAPSGGAAPVAVFESGAILMYLAEKTGQFPPKVFPVNSVKAMRGCLWIGAALLAHLPFSWMKTCILAMTDCRWYARRYFARATKPGPAYTPAPALI